MGRWAGISAPFPQVGDAYLDTATEAAEEIRHKGASELPEAPHLAGAGQPRAGPDTQTTPGGDRLGVFHWGPLCTPPRLFPTWSSRPLRQGPPGGEVPDHLQCPESRRGRHAGFSPGAAGSLDPPGQGPG